MNVQVNPRLGRPLMYEGNWYPPGATFEVAPAAVAKYHRDDRIDQTISDYLRLGLVNVV